MSYSIPECRGKDEEGKRLRIVGLAVGKETYFFIVGNNNNNKACGKADNTGKSLLGGMGITGRNAAHSRITSPQDSWRTVIPRHIRMLLSPAVEKTENRHSSVSRGFDLSAVKGDEWLDLLEYHASVL